jgi:hypothetical protein
LLELSRHTNDHALLKQPAVMLHSMKSGKTWPELIAAYPAYKSDRAWMRDP